MIKVGISTLLSSRNKLEINYFPLLDIMCVYYDYDSDVTIFLFRKYVIKKMVMITWKYEKYIFGI